MSYQKNPNSLLSIQWKIINLLLKDNECLFKIEKLKKEYFSGDSLVVFLLIESKFLSGKSTDWDIIENESGIEIPNLDIDVKIFDDLLSTLIDDYDKRFIRETFKSIEDEKNIEVIRSTLFSLVNEISSGEIPKDDHRTIVERILSGENKNRKGLIYTGVDELDHVLGGISDGEIVMLAGRPSMGKSGFAQQIMMKNSYHNDNITLYFTLEDSREKTIIRSMSHLSGVPYQKIIQGNIDGGDKLNLEVISEKFINAPFFIDDRTRSLVGIVSTSRKFKAKNPSCNLIIIDYIQQIPGEGSDYENLTDTSSCLVALAKDLHVGIIVVSQLNRLCEQREDKRPMNSDLRGSGGLEQDAHRILFLYRPYYYSKNEAEKHVCEFILSKNKHGEIANIIGNSHLACLQFR